MPAMGKLTFGEVTGTYRQQFQASEVRSNAKAYQDAGFRSGGGHDRGSVLDGKRRVLSAAKRA